ncbi:unnamed protein product [Paramecium primaurelia]|uniref:Uncharacterized protein n=1 Tax=Paramecium primaurelia TaxID=5886 RepID=A0A8S1KRB3_PARPR|nr:unnamed protein product [Paramecium primaurelia]
MLQIGRILPNTIIKQGLIQNSILLLHLIIQSKNFFHKLTSQSQQIFTYSKTKKNVTVLFISDGQEDCYRELIEQTRPSVENINFICIAVGNQFPTFISMNLREMYHYGDNSIPPLFLVDRISIQNLISNYSFLPQVSATKFMKRQTSIKILPCYQFPCDQMTEIVQPNSWVTSYSDELVTENGKLEKIEVKGQQRKLKQAFLERVQGQQQAFNQILQKLRFLTSSQTLQELDEATAAQRLKIGTQIGRYYVKL